MDLTLSPVSYLYLIFPAGLGFSLAHADVESRLAALGAIAKRLQGEYPELEWSVRPSSELQSMLANKGGMLHGRAKRPNQTAIADAVAATGLPITMDGEMTEEVVYFDHGIVNAVYTIPLRVTGRDDLASLPKVALAIIDALQGEVQVAPFRDHRRFQKTMRQAFAQADALHDMWGILLGGGDGRGPIMCVSQNFIFSTSATGSITVSKEELPALLTPFTGLAAEDNGSLLVNSEGIEYLGEGWEGQVAVISDPSNSDWLKPLWMTSTDYWAVLSDLDGYLYENTLAMTSKARLDTRTARRRMEAIRRIEVSIEILAHETVPTNYGDTSDQSTVYRGIYDSWEIGPLLENVKGKIGFLRATHDSLSARLADAMQERMNIVMATFTFLTFAGVLADVISSIDFNGSHFATPARTLLIAGGTILGALLSVLIGLLVFRRSQPED